MPKVVTDEMLAVFAEEGAWADVPVRVKKRYDGLLDRITYYLPLDDTGTDKQWRKTVEMFHA
ncbi:MAG: hypothetical protein HY238_13860 [Acidobacteria bacterium]|nr:hypothetical protein [Acidobacteriota bacterium]